MASRKFRFVSPGVFLKEIDRSQLPAQADAVGPVIIGRTRKGPALRPYKVKSLAEFERVFGSTMPGNQGEDNWREGTGILAESYAPYAAKAYLSADIDSPITIVRLLGVSGQGATAGSGEPGWDVGNAVGLFLAESGSTNPLVVDLTLAGVFYGAQNANFGIKLKGVHSSGTAGGIETRAMGQAVQFDSSGKLTAILSSSTHPSASEITFSIEEMREKFNTNPTKLNYNISKQNSTTLSHHYFLGETFEESYKRFNAQCSKRGKGKVAVVIPLETLMEDFRSLQHGATAARSGWVIAQDTQALGTGYDPGNMQKLFRTIALSEGEYSSQKIIIGIEDINIPRVGDTNEYGSFTVVVKEITSAKLVELERFEDCSLDPNSQNHVAKRIGDQFIEWDETKKRNRLYGSNLNVSEYIRIDMHPEVEELGPEPKNLVPFGFLGPVKQKKSVVTPDGQSVATGADWLNATSINLSGAADVSSSGRRFQFSWPSMPLVHTGSNSPMLGVTPFKQTWGHASSSTPGLIVDPGYAEFLRRAPSYSTIAEKQISGEIDSNCEYSFRFSLDDVILVPREGTTDANISDTGDLRSTAGVVYSSGSKAAAQARKAQATIDFAGQTGFHLGDAPRFGDDDQENSRVFFKFKAQDGTAIAVTGGFGVTTSTTDTNSPTFAFSDPPSAPHRATGLALNFMACINANSKFNAYTVGTKVFIEQAVAGGGNSANSTIEITRTGGFTDDGSASAIIAQQNLDSLIDKTVGFEGGATSAGTSWSAKADASTQIELRTLLNIVDGFHMPLAGGSDGVDILESNPFNNRVLSSDATTGNNYAFASVDRAIELISDAEAVEHNLAVMPGITNESLTTKLVRACEARADSLAIIDLPDIYKPPSQNYCESFRDRVDGTTPETTAAKLVARQLNSSYGASYYPWVKIRDDRYTKDVWVPPSVVALGVMAYTEERDDVWFAPAGFNRGGLSEGNAGCTVLQASEQLLAKDRDTLYAANINPVAQFVSEGLVIFGQKTLQSTPSALDRINVRRLLIFVKKEISRIANGILFEQNVQATWKKFTNQVVPFLESVKVRFGLSDFKVVLDETTTTPDLIDRNILYAKVFLKPARSIEFIAVDFIITRTGAAYDD